MPSIDGNERVRRCGDCEENVFLVENEEQLRERTQARQCVALAEAVADELLARMPDLYHPEKAGEVLTGLCLPFEGRLLGRIRLDEE